MNLGWDDTGRVHSVILHVQIRAEKIWVEWDGTEQGIAEELLAAGIPKEEIVLGFYRPERRSLSGERCCLKVMMGLSDRASTAINPKCTSIPFTTLCHYCGEQLPDILPPSGRPVGQ